MKKSLLTFFLAVMGLAIAAPASAWTGTRAGALELIDYDVQDISLSYSGGVMHIAGANNMVVTVYNLAGIAVKSFRVDGQDKRISLPLADGVYIIKVGTVFTRKVTVRR